MKKLGTWLLVLIVLAILVYAIGGFDQDADVAEDTADVVAEVVDNDDVEEAQEELAEAQEELEEAQEELADAEEELAEAEEELEEEVAEAQEEAAEEDDIGSSASVDLAASSVLRVGRAAGKAHNGTVELTSASLEMDGETIVGGSFVIDMDSLTATDIDSEKLDNHLKAEDFFDVANHPTATLIITAVDGDTATADLTIKGETHPVDFVITQQSDTYVTSFSIDSSVWGVQDSGIKDALVADDIDFDVTVVVSE